MINLHAAERSLRKVIADDQIRHRALTQLALDGLAGDVGDGTVHASASAGKKRLLTPIQAAERAAGDPERAGMFDQLMARARRLGIRLENDKHVDLRDVDAALRASRASESDRFWIKNALFAVGMIDP